MFPGMVFYQKPDGLACSCLIYMIVFIFHGNDLLGEIRAVAFYPDRVASSERAFTDLDHGYTEVTVIVGYDT